ncbi:MAG: ABC transporter permease [Chloroflexi bacterium]|nr:ABC transporter permease [Chloroflexota bacterium]
MTQRQQAEHLGAALARPTRLAKFQRSTAAVARALRKNPNMAFGAVVITVMIFIAIFAPLLGTSNPKFLVPRDRLISPGADHFFGTDHLGRDVYSRVFFGSRVSLQVGAGVSISVITLGLFFGLISGYNRLLDKIIMRFADGLMAIPAFLLAIALMTLLGPSLRNVIIALTISSVPGTTRLVRALVLSLREQEYVTAARAIGSGPIRIVVRHIFPNTVAPVLVLGSFITASAIISEAGLSFLGAGIPADTPSWGNIMGQARQYNQIAVWILFFPGLFLSLTVLGANLVGDGLRDTLDPRLRRLA